MDEAKPVHVKLRQSIPCPFSTQQEMIAMKKTCSPALVHVSCVDCFAVIGTRRPVRHRQPIATQQGPDV